MPETDASRPDVKLMLFLSLSGRPVPVTMFRVLECGMALSGQQRIALDMYISWEIY
jgi:hypothetical protein